MIQQKHVAAIAYAALTGGACAYSFGHSLGNSHNPFIFKGHVAAIFMVRLWFAEPWPIHNGGRSWGRRAWRGEPGCSTPGRPR